MPLTPFDPLTKKFILATAPNYLAEGQGSGSLIITSDNEDAGAVANNMRFDDHQTAWRSDTLGGLITNDWDLGQTVTIDFFAMGGNNLEVPDGWQFQFWTADPVSGSLVVDIGPDLDPIVRTDDAVVSKFARKNLDASRNVSPVAFPSASGSWIRVILDTTSGNGAAAFAEVAFAFAGLSLDVDDCLKKGNSLKFIPLSKTSRSGGGGGGTVPRMRLKKQDFHLSFLEESETLDLAAFLGTDEGDEKVFVWSDPANLDTFAYKGFFGFSSGSQPGLTQISQITHATTDVMFEERL